MIFSQKRGLARLNFPKKMQGGFTLIELLTVISIMGLIASIVLTATQAARMKARDTQRIQALEEVRKALTLYYHDYGYYPPSTGAFSSTGNVLWANLGTALSPYISALPKDPINSATPSYSFISNNASTYYAYGYRSYPTSGTPTDYDLIARFETSNSLNCTNKQWVTHAGAPGAGSNLSTVWCSAPISGTPNLYSDH